MNGSVAQIVALTCFGNAVLAGGKTLAFFPDNSTCVYCDRVVYVVAKRSLLGKTKERTVADTPDDWFGYLKSVGSHGIRLSCTPQNDPNILDRMSAGFIGGGGTWAMEVLLPRQQSEYWIPTWEVWNQDAPESRIWRVIYGRISTTTTPDLVRPDLAYLADRLENSLLDVRTFSEEHDCGSFTTYFADALETLNSKGKHLHGYHKDLAPEGVLSQQAATILDACQRSWVFGGMGSWNDMGFDGKDQEVYERVSDQLFQTVNAAIAGTASSTNYGEGSHTLH